MGALLVGMAKVLMSYLKKSYLKKRNNAICADADNRTGGIKGKKDCHDYYMVCWLTSLAQRQLKFVKSEDTFAIYTSGTDLCFYLFKTSIHDKDNLQTVSYEEQSKNIVFDIRIDRITYPNKGYNKLIFRFKDCFRKLSVKWFGKVRPEKEVSFISAEEYNRLCNEINGNSRKPFGFLPSAEAIGAPLELSLELLESLPCGICQFKITSATDDYIIIEEVKKYIFDQIHTYFHHHHFCHNGLQENMPLLDVSPKDIITPDNESVKHFIGNITDALINKLDDIYKSYKILLVTNKIKREKGQKRISKKKLVRSSWEFFNDCDNLLGIHAFLTTILNSPRNCSICFGHGNLLKEEDKYNRETAMLIESAYKGTVALMQKISHHEDFRKQRRSMHAAIFGIWASAIFSFIGIVVSICSSDEARGWFLEKWNFVMAWFGLQ